MAYVVPTLEELFEMLLADAQARFPDDDYSRYSDNWKRLRILAGGITDNHAHIDSNYDNLLPERAEDEFLDTIGARYGVTRKQATPAYQYDALRLVGTAASTFTLGDALVHTDGTRYQLNESGSIPGAGFVDVDCLAIDTGSVTRKQAGEVLAFVTAPSGIQSKAELQLDLSIDGDDIESNGDYRQRILDRIALPGMGGNANDYRTWALEVTGISFAYVYPHRNGIGSVDVAALHGGTGEDRSLTIGERAELEDYINARRPVSVADFRILETVAEDQAIEVLVEPENDSTYEFDWSDDPALEVLTWTGATRTLQFATDRPSSMAVGDRIVIKSQSAPYNDGSELTIEGLSSTDTVVLSEAPDVTPVAGDTVYAGGPLVAGIRDAILEHVNTMGTVRGNYAAQALAWEGTLRTSTLFRIVQTYTGVLDSEIADPIANVDATDDPPADTIGYLIPRYVIVRRRH